MRFPWVSVTRPYSPTGFPISGVDDKQSFAIYFVPYYFIRQFFFGSRCNKSCSALFGLTKNKIESGKTLGFFFKQVHGFKFYQAVVEWSSDRTCELYHGVLSNAKSLTKY